MSKIQQNPFFMEFVSNFLSAENCKRTTTKKNTLTEMLQEKKFSKPTILLFAQQALMSTICSKGQKL